MNITALSCPSCQSMFELGTDPHPYGLCKTCYFKPDIRREFKDKPATGAIGPIGPITACAGCPVGPQGAQGPSGSNDDDGSMTADVDIYMDKVDTPVFRRLAPPHKISDDDLDLSVDCRQSRYLDACERLGLYKDGTSRSQRMAVSRQLLGLYDHFKTGVKNLGSITRVVVSGGKNMNKLREAAWEAFEPWTYHTHYQLVIKAMVRMAELSLDTCGNRTLAEEALTVVRTELARHEAVLADIAAGKLSEDGYPICEGSWESGKKHYAAWKWGQEQDSRIERTRRKFAAAGITMDPTALATINIRFAGYPINYTSEANRIRVYDEVWDSLTDEAIEGRKELICRPGELEQSLLASKHTNVQPSVFQCINQLVELPKTLDQAAAAKQNELFRKQVKDMVRCRRPDPEIHSSHLYKELPGAIARGWCTEENKDKIMDPVLVDAIAREVSVLMLQATRHAYDCGRKDGAKAPEGL